MNGHHSTILNRYVVSLQDAVYSPPDLMAELENRGHRTTTPRKAIAKLLEQADEGLTAEAINEMLPSVGRATVFRTIKLFLELGVVCKIPMTDGSHVYGLTRAVCLQCGAMVEFRAATLVRQPIAPGAPMSGQIADHHIELHMTCDYCRADGGK